MVQRHRDDREHQDNFHEERWQKEGLKRAARIRSGFKGLWDKINGRYWKNRKINEREAWLAYQRDRREREELINKQLAERQNLQTQINLLREKQEQERKALLRELSHAQAMEDTKVRQKKKIKRACLQTQKHAP